MHAAILVSIAYPPLNCKMERYGKKTHTVEWDYQKQKEKTQKKKKKKNRNSGSSTKMLRKGKIVSLMQFLSM